MYFKAASILPPRQASLHAGHPPRARPSAWCYLSNHRFSTCLGGQRQARESISLSLGWNLSCRVIRPPSQGWAWWKHALYTPVTWFMSEGRCRRQPMRSEKLVQGVTAGSTGEAAFQTPARSLRFLIWEMHTEASPLPVSAAKQPRKHHPELAGPLGPRQAFVKLDFS